MMLTKEEILKKLRENKEKLKNFGVKKIGIFGSFMRGEANRKSDIDIVVEFDRGKAIFKNVSGLLDFLEEIFGREVDLLTPDGVESIRLKHVKEEIKRGIEYA
ncbi:MAG: nucleotidyltransferase family protein [Candidatus Helarchaeales archaeon]